MDFLPPVVAKLIADVGEFNAAMGASEAKLTGFQAAQSKLAGAGKVAMAGLAIATAAVAYESVKLASSFNQTMELVHTQAGASQAEVEALKKSVLDLSPAVGIGPEKLAEGLYHIESTGFRGKQAMDILTAAAKDAAMGLADLDTVTFALSGTMSVGMKDIKDAADATAYLNAIVGMGDMKMDKLAAAIGTGVLPSFKSAGLGMVDFGASLATITDNSVGADEAATRLRMTVSLMAAPSGKAAKALESIGISSTQLADDMRKPDGLLVAVMDLKTHLEESGKTATEQNAIVSKAFGGGRSSSAILTLIEESDRLKSKYAGLGTASSRAAQQSEAWAQQQKQFSQQMHELGAEVQVIGVKIGEFLIPYIQKSAEWLTKHIGVVKIAAFVIGTILVAAMMAFTYAVIENTVAMLMNPVTWIVLAIIAAVALLGIGIYELWKHWGTVWGFIVKYALVVWHALVVAWNATWAFIAGVVSWIWTNIIQPIVSFFWNGLIKPIIEYFTIWWKLVQFAFTIVNGIIQDFAHIWMIVFNASMGVLREFWAGVQIVWNWLFDVAIRPMINLIQLLAHWWMIVFNGSMSVLRDFWAGCKVVWDWLFNVAIRPMIKVLGDVKVAWAEAMKLAGDAVHGAWIVMKPMFDVILGAIHAIRDAWNSVMNSPSSAGKSVLKFLGFETGGYIPGPPGAPRLVVAHGGEYVLSRDMISRGSVGAGGPSTGLSGGGSGGGGEDNTTWLLPVNVDGERFITVMIGPAQRRKARTGATGLS